MENRQMYNQCIGKYKYTAPARIQPLRVIGAGKRFSITHRLPQTVQVIWSFYKSNEQILTHKP